MEGQRGSAVAYDRNGTVIKKFRGSGGMGYHQQNFIDAVRSRDRSILNAEVQIGNDTTGWCNLANIAFRAGQPYDGQQNIDLGAGQELWDNLLSETKHGLAPYGLALNSDGIQMSSILEMDAATERFVGQHADEANGYLKRQYRAPFVVPEIA